jgi:adenylylsulfate kinase-like enzyme
LEEALASKEKIIWLFGRSGAGKTTLASHLVSRYKALGMPCLWVDGDRVRQGLSQELGFTPSERMENHRRIIEVANIAEEQGLQVIVSAIAPKAIIRSKVNELAKSPVAWVYLETDETTCRQRDTKGLYAAAADGNFSQLFEPPVSESVLIEINTSAEDISTSQSKLYSVLGISNK